MDSPFKGSRNNPAMGNPGVSPWAHLSDEDLARLFQILHPQKKKPKEKKKRRKRETPNLKSG